MVRWRILIAAIWLQVCFGGLYAWSVLVKPLQENYGFSALSTQLIFGVCIFICSISMILAGKNLQRFGTRRIATFGALFFGSGYMLSALQINPPMLFLGYSIVTGIGIGMGYVCPIVVCMNWFPRHKGLITGLTVAGFGSGAILLSSLLNFMLNRGLELNRIFLIVGLFYIVSSTIAARFMFLPQSVSGGSMDGKFEIQEDSRKSIFVLCLGMFSGTFAGLAVIGSLEAMGEFRGLSKSLSVAAVSIFAVGNGLGRITWGWIFDRLKTKSIPLSLALLGFSLFFFKASGNSGFFFLTSSFSVGFCFGACFVVYAGAVSFIFGTENVGKIYPIVFMAYGISGVVGPPLGGFLFDLQGTYRTILIISAMLPGIALLFTLRLSKVCKKC